MKHSMDEIIKTEKPKYHFDIDALQTNLNGWKNIKLKLKKSYDPIYKDGLCIAEYCEAVKLGHNALEFYSDKHSVDEFFDPEGEHSKIRTCTLVDFDVINKGEIYLISDSTVVNLKDYLTSEVEKKFEKFTHKIYVGDLIWFHTTFYADSKNDRLIDITATGFVTFYSESEIKITYRGSDNEIHMTTLRPELLKMFDWYIIDENKEYDKR